jgi:lactoylglutathione lyase
MTFKGIHHIGLFVKDPEKSLKFYVDLLGGKVVKTFPMRGAPEKTVHFVSLGGDTVLEIVPRGTGEEETNAHWAHVAFLTDDTRAAYDLAVKAGAPSRTEPQDAMLGDMSICNAFVFGPDGEVVEFFTLK